MSETPNSTTSRITRKQAVLLSVLIVTLLAVLIGNRSDQSTSFDNAAAARPNRSRQDTAKRPSDWKPNWPKTTVSAVVKTNPFASIAGSALDAETETSRAVNASAPAINNETPLGATESPLVKTDGRRDREQREASEALKAQRVKLTLRAGDQSAALIGNCLIRQGDILNGHRVIEILPTGITLEPLRVEP